MRSRVFDPFLQRIRAMRWVARAAAAVFAGCASPAATPAPPPAPVTLAEVTIPEDVDPYRDAGFIVASGSIPFVGGVSYAATEYLDSTAVTVALSIPPRALSFVRAGDRYAAYYSVKLDLLQGDAIVRSERPSGEVRVASFSETTRGDEGVIFQRVLRLAPGAYAIRVTANDSLGTGTGTATHALSVPLLSDGAIAPPVPVFTAEPRSVRHSSPTVIANPRSTVRFGRDSSFQLYIEAYGASTPDTLIVVARRGPSNGAVLASDTVRLPAKAPVRAVVPSISVSRLGLGPLRMTVERADGSVVDSLGAFVTLGIDIPVFSIEELIEALRYFASEAEVQRVRAASASARPAQWAALVRKTDPNPATPDNEALLEFARRLRVADRLYRDSTHRGWQTARGAVLAALGEPDSMTDPQPADSVGIGRVVAWDYRRHRTLLVFEDPVGRGTWQPLRGMPLRRARLS
jgi:GWxTD domain-containing protein